MSVHVQKGRKTDNLYNNDLPNTNGARENVALFFISPQQYIQVGEDKYMCTETWCPIGLQHRRVHIEVMKTSG
jgi:hypothetical protein